MPEADKLVEQWTQDEAAEKQARADFVIGQREQAAVTDQRYQATLASARQRDERSRQQAKAADDKVASCASDAERHHVFAQGVRAKLNDAIRAHDGPNITRLSKQFDLAKRAEDDALARLDAARRERDQVGVERA
jgi:hypothetical protein